MLSITGVTISKNLNPIPLGKVIAGVTITLTFRGSSMQSQRLNFTKSQKLPEFLHTVIETK